MLSLDYIAGFFDGEGSIGIYKKGQGRWHLRTQLTQNVSEESTALLKEVNDLFGGNIAEMKSFIYRGGKAFNWQVNGNRAVNLLQSLEPYLRLKKDQARVAIAWQNRKIGPRRDSLGRMMKEPYNPTDEIVSQLLKALKKNSYARIADQTYTKVLCELGVNL